MKISNQRALDAAEKIAKPLKDKYEQTFKSICTWVTDRAKEKIPEVITQAYSIHPEYFKTDSSVYVAGCKIDDHTVYFKFDKPLISPPYGAKFLTDVEKMQVVQMFNAYETEIEKYNKTVRDIKNTILSLGTDKRVQVDFPEAFPYLSEPMSNINTGLMLNIDPVRMLACSLIPGCEGVAVPN